MSARAQDRMTKRERTKGCEKDTAKERVRVVEREREVGEKKLQEIGWQKERIYFVIKNVNALIFPFIG